VQDSETAWIHRQLLPPAARGLFCKIAPCTPHFRLTQFLIQTKQRGKHFIMSMAYLAFLFMLHILIFYQIVFFVITHQFVLIFDIDPAAAVFFVRETAHQPTALPGDFDGVHI
jgi:hypothetical protein